MKYTPSPEEIDRVLSCLVIRKRVKEKSGPHVIADCPFCGKAKHLYANQDSGLFDCKRCKESGGLFALANALGVRVKSEKPVIRSATTVLMTGLKRAGVRKTTRNAPGVTMEKILEMSARVLDPDDDHGTKVRGYLHARHIDDAAIEHFKLGVGYIGKSKELAVAIPYLEGDKVPLVKFRNLAVDKADRRFARTKGSDSPLFNVDAIKDRKRVVMVEGEMDAISLWQSGVTDVVSTSTGAQDDIPQRWKEHLANAEDIVLWYDDDEAGEDAIENLVRSIGSHRVRVAVVPDSDRDAAEKALGGRATDANDLIRGGIDRERIQTIVKNALTPQNTDMVPVQTVGEAWYSQLAFDGASLGVPTGFPGLDRLVRGWRMGELSIWTGHTSHGKTTCLSFILQHNAHVNGEPTMFTSPEDGPQALFQKLFVREFKRPLSTVTAADKQEIYELLPKIYRDPIYIMNRIGRISIEDLYEAIRFSSSRLGVRQIMVDHLAYFTKSNPRDNDREHYDSVLLSLREMAHELNVHIHLIAHPRGDVEDMTIPDGSSIKGTSSVKQVTHNGFTIFRPVDPLGDAVKGKNKGLKLADGRRLDLDLAKDEVLLYAWKIRHDEGKTGRVIFRFDGRSLSYRDTAQPVQEEISWGDDGGVFPADDPFDGLDLV